MATGIFAVLDDIASLMDDVVVATKKTAGILGDDLAVNANKATGFVSSRELPVLWKITQGSLVNKAIIVPIALLLNIIYPVAIKWILVFGGLYLAFEGVEKIIHYLFHKKEGSASEKNAPKAEENDLMVAEKIKVKEAISTDFILSVEIVIIALGTVLGEPLIRQIITVCVVSVLATVGVYGFVALIVRMDDLGFSLIKKSENKGLLAKIGRLLISALPIIIRAFAVIGTVALILVAGGIFAHYIPQIHHITEEYRHIPEILIETGAGLAGGGLVYGFVSVIRRLRAVAGF